MAMRTFRLFRAAAHRQHRERESAAATRRTSLPGPPADAASNTCCNCTGLEELRARHRCGCCRGDRLCTNRSTVGAPPMVPSSTRRVVLLARVIFAVICLCCRRSKRRCSVIFPRSSIFGSRLSFSPLPSGDIGVRGDGGLTAAAAGGESCPETSKKRRYSKIKKKRVRMKREHTHS